MTTVPYYKVCPECRTEHTHVTLRCADCDVELVHPDSLAPEPEAVVLPPASELTCIRVAPLAWIRALSEGLERQGTTHRVEPASAEDAPEGQNSRVFGEAQLFGLYVQIGDATGARELDTGIAAQILPEEAPMLEEGEEDVCPACSHTLAADDTECPDCGLVIAV